MDINFHLTSPSKLVEPRVTATGILSQTIGEGGDLEYVEGMAFRECGQSVMNVVAGTCHLNGAVRSSVNALHRSEIHFVLVSSAFPLPTCVAGRRVGARGWSMVKNLLALTVSYGGPGWTGFTLIARRVHSPVYLEN